MKKILRVTGCIIRHQDTILLLHRSEQETDPSLWGIPAGRVEDSESDAQAVVREIFEETGIATSEEVIEYLGQLDIEYADFTVEFPIFYLNLIAIPEVKLDPDEHIAYKWMTPKKALELPDLMLDVDKIIQKFCVNMLKI